MTMLETLHHHPRRLFVVYSTEVRGRETGPLTLGKSRRVPKLIWPSSHSLFPVRAVPTPAHGSVD